KAINDSLGHESGDRLLVQIAAVFKNYRGPGRLPREFFLPIRYGGDEFFILMPGVPKAAAVAFLQGIGETVRSTQFEIGGHRVNQKITLSIGVSNFPEDMQDSTRLFDAADKAAYAAKRSGRDRCCTPSDAARVSLDKDNLHRLLPCSRLIGRDDLMSQAKQSLAPGHGRMKPIWLLEGKQGSGRTRFLEELQKVADPPRCQPVFCRSLPFLMQQPFGVLIDALQQLCRRDPKLGEHMANKLDVRHRSEIGRLMPEWARFTVLGEKEDEGDKQVASLEHAFALALLAITEQPYNRQLVIMLDDVQWIDPQTLGVLEKVKKAGNGGDVFVVMAARTSDSEERKNRPLASFVSRLAGAKLLDLRELEPLTFPHVAELLGAVIPGTEEQKALVYTIYQRSLGLPLLVEEIIKYLIQRDFIRMRDKSIEIAEVQEKDIPSNLSDLMLLRTQNLDQEILEVITQASIMGQSFDVESLHELNSGKNEGYLLDILERGKKLGLLREDAVGHFEFTSENAQQAFYAKVPESQRKRMHEQIGAAAEKRSEKTRQETGSIDTTALAQLSYHFDAAGSTDRARHHLETVASAYAALLPTMVSSDLLRKMPSRQKDWGQETELPPDRMPLALRLIRTMKSAVQNFRAFPPHSEVVVDSQKRLLDELQEMLTGTETLTFSAVEQTVLVNGKEIPVARGQKKPGQEFAEFLGDSGLRGVSFKRGIDPEEIRGFVSVMAMAPEDIAAQGGWDALQEKLAFKNVVVNQMIFVTMTERELLRSTPVAAVAVPQPMVDSAMAGDAAQALRALAQLGPGQEGLNLKELKEHLATLVDVLKQLPGSQDGVAASAPGGVSKAEIQRLMSLQADLSQKYREMTRYLSNQIVDQVNLDLSVVVRDLESGHKFKIGAATDILLSRGAEALEQLIRLAMTTEDERARRIAIQVARKIEPDLLPRVLSELYATQNYEEKCNLLACLAEFDDPRVLEQLETFLRFPDRSVRREAIGVLESNPALPAGELLMKLLADENLGVRQDAVWALGRLKYPGAVAALVCMIGKRSIFRHEADFEVQREACTALGRIGATDGLEPLKRVWRQDAWYTMRRNKPPEVRAAAVTALAFHPAEAVRDFLETVAASERHEVVKGAARVALDRISGRQKPPEMETLRTRRGGNSTMRRMQDLGG
ncbi:MAG: HEAT repeat domain-containing protein, partial [Candidatus Xenobia bacterium]